MRKNPSGFRILEAILANQWLGATPMEHRTASLNSSRNLALMARPSSSTFTMVRKLRGSQQANSSMERMWSTWRQDFTAEMMRWCIST